MGGRQPPHCRIDRRVKRWIEKRQRRKKLLGYIGIIERFRHVGQRHQGQHITGHIESLGAEMVIKRSHPRHIASPKQALLSFIPDDKGKIAQQMGGTCRAPFLIGIDKELAVGECLALLGRDRESGAQVIPVVEPHIRRNRETGCSIALWQGLLRWRWQAHACLLP